MSIYNSKKEFNSEFISTSLVKKLINNQYPEYKDLTIKPVEKQGWDNRPYRLGENKLIRLPSAEYYSIKIPKEQKYLPLIAPYLTTNISKPIKIGNPSSLYPFNFAIYNWIDGVSANLLKFNNKKLEILATQLAIFLTELHSINNIAGPPPGKHNGWGGDELNLFDEKAKNQINELKNIINQSKSLDLWEKAKKSKWDKKPVWIHGDFYFGNFLIKNNELTGVIDFGGIAKADPAKDLVIAWTFLRNKSRDIFKNKITYDSDTWIRAKGWALWKATFELCKTKNKASEYANSQKRIINDILTDD